MRQADIEPEEFTSITNQVPITECLASTGKIRKFRARRRHVCQNPQCCKVYATSRKHSKYCSGACRVQVWYWRQKRLKQESDQIKKLIHDELDRMFDRVNGKPKR